MSTVRRVALSVLVAALMAGVGAVGGFVVHWYVLQPSDDELHDEVAEVTPEDLTIVSEPAITGRWAPSLERGWLHWEAVADGHLTAAAVARHMEGAGWEPEPPRQTRSVQHLVATKGSLYLSARLSPAPDEEGTDVGFTITRRPYPISLGTSMVLGAGLGALVGGALGWFRPHSGEGGNAARGQR